jgi:hypothetical protein
MFGLSSLGVLMAPLALQEMVMAVWLIAKGFTPRAVAPGVVRGLEEVPTGGHVQGLAPRLT